MDDPIYHVDAFTERPFAGNPAAVCLLSSERDDRWLVGVAAEMNLSETAFLVPEPDGWRLRWFTPTLEVDLCGHATLASAHVLWETGRAPADATLRFRTRSGDLFASLEDGAIALDFPAEPAEDIAPPEGLLSALGLESDSSARNVARSRLDYLVELDGEGAVRALDPDFRALEAATQPARGVIATAASDLGAPQDFVSRYFAPAAGIDEDPVTGSAHCTLGPYWATRLGRNPLRGRQVSARGGAVGVRICGGGRVRLSGTAVTIARGTLA